MSNECICTGPTGNGIKYSYIDSCGRLVFVYDNNYTNTVGKIDGPTGSTGYTGPKGPTGPSGVGIQLVYLDSCCNLIIVLTDGSTINAGNYSSCTDCGGPSCTSSLIYYGYLAPSGNTWPPNITPPPVNPVPTLGDFYVNVNTGCLYTFTGQSWITCPSDPSPVINTSGDIVFSGSDIPFGSTWPANITPTPSQSTPYVGNMYANTTNGSLYLFNSSWNNIQSGNSVRLRTYQMTIHIAPSAGVEGYGVQLSNILINQPQFILNTTNVGTNTVQLVGVGALWPPPINSTYFVCNEDGIFNISLAFNYNDFSPSAPNQNTGDIVIYILDSFNNYTNQSYSPGIQGVARLGIGYKIVIYATSPSMNNILSFDVVNSSAFLEISRKF